MIWTGPGGPVSAGGTKRTNSIGRRDVRNWDSKRTSVRLSPYYSVSQSLKVFLRQLHEETLATFPTPSIAIDAADQPFAVMVDLDKLAIAFLAGTDLIIVQAHDTHSPCSNLFVE